MLPHRLISICFFLYYFTNLNFVFWLNNFNRAFFLWHLLVWCFNYSGSHNLGSRNLSIILYQQSFYNLRLLLSFFCQRGHSLSPDQLFSQCSHRWSPKQLVKLDLTSTFNLKLRLVFYWCTLIWSFLRWHDWHSVFLFSSGTRWGCTAYIINISHSIKLSTCL